MAKRIFEIIWKDRREAMELSLEMIGDCCVEDAVDNSSEINRLERLIKEEEGQKLKASRLAMEGVFDGDKDILKKILAESNSKIEMYTAQMNALVDSGKTDFNKGVFLSQVHDALEQEIDFSKPVISYDVIDSLINKIICRENSEFAWILNFDKPQNMQPVRRINHLSEEYKKTLIVDTNFEIFLEFEIPFEESQAYMKTRGRRIIKRGWDTLKVKVALDKN